MAGAWNLLVVDDDEDVQNITRIALRRKTWRERAITVTSARSGAAARELLSAPDAPLFHCALVDVVMETNDAGLQLCDFIRSTIPRTTRIILRTGQPGAAPPERVMNDYDIDYYLAKTEVTEDRLFMTLRACFRSSLDIAALLAVEKQLRAFTLALREVSTTRDSLAGIMRESLRFLEEKYGATIAFVADVSSPAGRDASVPAEVVRAIAAGHKQKLAPMEMHAAERAGLAAGSFLVLTTALNAADRSQKSMGEKLRLWFQSLVKESGEDGAAGGIVVNFERELTPKARPEFMHDLDLFVANWRVADGSLRLQDRIVRERLEMMKSITGSV